MISIYREIDITPLYKLYKSEMKKKEFTVEMA